MWLCFDYLHTTSCLFLLSNLYWQLCFSLSSNAVQLTVKCSPLDPRRCTHRLYELNTVGEIAHEGERADALGKPWDLAEAHHEAVLLAELVQGPAITLVVVDELHFVLRGDETLQQLKEVQTQSSLVIPAGMALI